jgi:hypothetical protein
MRLFTAIGNYFTRARARRNLRVQFTSYADPKLVECVLSAPDTAVFALRPARVDFILVLVRDDDPEQAARLAGDVAQAIQDCGGFVDAMLGSIVFVTFGMFGAVGGVGAVERRSAAEAMAQRLAAVTQLGQRLGGEIQVLHGSTDAMVGDFGGGGRSHFGAVPLQFGRMAQVLTSLKRGEIREWDAGTSAEDRKPAARTAQPPTG